MTAKYRHIDKKYRKRKKTDNNNNNKTHTRKKTHKEQLLLEIVKANIEINSGNNTMIINKTRTMMDMNEH